MLNQQSIPVASQVLLYQHVQPLRQPIQQIHFQGMPFQVQPIVQVNLLTLTQQPLQRPVPSTPQTLLQSVVSMTVQNPSLGSPRIPILGVS